MRVRRALLIPAVSALVFNAMALAPLVPSVALAGSTTRLISASGTTRMTSTSVGNGAVAFPEIRGEPAGEMTLPSDKAAKRDLTNRSKSAQRSSTSAFPAAPTTPSRIAPTRGVATTFLGLNHRDQRTANSGNQFSLEPPDQGLCVGNGFILETINDVMRVSDTHGNALVTKDLNTFYNYPAAIVRSTLTFGPFITDPSCYYDPGTARWFHVVLTLDVVPTTGDFIGTSHLDLAVSNTSDPKGAWTIYKIHTEDDGSLGQPNHHCSLGTGFGPCFGDYPHIGADANGFYITTNEYSFFGPEFTSAQIYAFSKAILVAHPVTVPVVQMDTAGLDSGKPGFTIWPATSPGAIYATGSGGTEYFLSTNAAEEANGNGSSSTLLVWALTNTASLGSAPALRLSHAAVGVHPYSVPPKADQKIGSIPLGDCLNDRTTKSALWNGSGCWRAFFDKKDRPKREVESHLDANDTRMQQVVFANGKLWGAIDTAVSVGGEIKAGIAWYVVTPSVTSNQVSGSLAKQGTMGVAHQNLSYPAVGVLPSGKGAIAFTMVGRDYFPSAAWASLDATHGAGAIHVISPGAGPSDSFTSYKAFVGNPPRTRWGDYGAAAMDGTSIWLASESIEQSCTFAEFVGTAFSCGGTRTALGNWATRISEVKP